MPQTPPAAAIAAPRLRKVPVYLITQDDDHWGQVGRGLDPDCTLKQVDSIDELLTTVPSGQGGVIIWDARSHADHAESISRLQLHSPRFAIVALDTADHAGAWETALQRRQIVALVETPLNDAYLSAALGSAREEFRARTALLGDSGAAPPAAPPAARSVARFGGGKLPRFALWLVAALLVAGAAAALLYRGAHTGAVAPAARNTDTPIAPAMAPPAGTPPAAADEKVDTLLENARQAMLDRHFIEPADGNALALYRNVLNLDPANGEAQQGLQRLAQILLARVQAYLDERKFDLALQALETARSISPRDARLAPLDARVVNLRAELGAAQIQAALNAQNFDRAALLLDEAVRVKSISTAKLNLLREEVRRRREESEFSRFAKLIDARLQQEHLVEPRNDNAVFYLQQARQAGVSAAALQGPTLELAKRLLQGARTAIDQHRFAEVDRLLAEARNFEASPSALAALQRDLTAARSQQREKAEQAQVLDAATARLAQAGATGPANEPGQAAKPGQPRTDGSAAGGAAKSLVMIKPMRLSYPSAAQRNGTQGWVDLAFTVTPEGKVGEITVIDASPAGVFDAAAKSALAGVRYKPFLRDGQAVAVSSKVRIKFQLSDP